jgi:DNA-binding NarL/FixJ family response regulator
MIIMVVCACEEFRHQLAEALPLSDSDVLIQASGLLSAVWQVTVTRPDLIVVDPWPPDDCSAHLLEMLKSACPNTPLQIHPRPTTLQL